MLNTFSHATLCNYTTTQCSYTAETKLNIFSAFVFHPNSGDTCPEFLGKKLSSCLFSDHLTGVSSLIIFYVKIR